MSGIQGKQMLEPAQNANQRCGTKKKEKLTQEKLKRILHYDQETGVFTWVVSNTNSISVGSVAGTIGLKGYRIIGVDGERYKASRLAWFYMEGYWPENCLDHIDRDRANDKWNNLRHVSQACNTRNQSVRKTSVSGVTGVTWYKPTKRWLARICVDYKVLNLGYFKAEVDAVKARWEAEKKYGFPNCNTTSSAYQYIQKTS